MKKVFEEKETLFVILLIVAYVVANSYCMQNFGIADYRSTIVNTLFSLLLIVLMVLLGRVKFYGITGMTNVKQYLYFLPLVLIVSTNLWGGINTANTPDRVLFHILTMINVGFIEEIIFRGFLYQMMAKTNVKSAMIVSALTFGLGHIVNLLNGRDLVPTLLQICYAVALGYLFVLIYQRSKSLIPCILTHMGINSLSIFDVGNAVTTYLVPVFLVVASVAYSFYISKTVAEVKD